MESFSGAALALAFVAVATWRPVRAYVVTMLILVLATMWAARSFPMDLRYPVPVLITVWYALHVPLSFTAYALWGAAAAAGLTWFTGRDPAMLARVDRFALLGMGLWSLSMVFGGIWGVLAWGAYFLWDPKIVWSVILWFHYATFVHLRLTPSLQRRPFVRPALALVGLVFVFVAYVGTSFFFGDSSHAFE
jgi:ABC-type transport system involved in cytochrome c biogenesis permease subunit